MKNKIIGAKAEGLIFLKNKGFRVPEFYILDYESLQDKDPDALSADLNLPESKFWAVRSSADAEDGKELSYAGQFRTVLNVKTRDLSQACRKVLRAYKETEKSDYSQHKNIKYGLIIQEMLQADYSGVVFSHNPVNPAEEAVYINLVPGVGEQLVSGRANAFSVKISGKKVEYPDNENERFSGKTTDGKELSQKFSEIKSATKRQIKKLAQYARKLSKLKKYPADIEFAIVQKQIYFLQIRPITSPPQAEPVIWDNSNIGENYPGLNLPLTVSFVKRSYGLAYRAMASFLGFGKSEIHRNLHLFNNMSGAIKGGMYYNVSAWQKLLYQLPFGKKTSALLTKNWNVAEADFKKPPKPALNVYLKLFYNLLRSLFSFSFIRKKFIKQHKEFIIEYEDTAFDRFSEQDLRRQTEIIQQRLLSGWVAPMLNGFFAFIFFAISKKIIARSKISAQKPNFFNDILYSQGELISVKIVKSYRRISDMIAESADVQSFFKKNEPDYIFDKLPEKFPELFTEIMNYISEFGERCGEGELKMETLNYKENPQSFIALLKSSLPTIKTKQSATEEHNYKKSLHRFYRYRPLKHLFLKILIKQTLNRVRDRENFRFYRTQTFHIYRRIFRALGRKFEKNGKINDRKDILFLKYEEIFNEKHEDRYFDLISERKQKYKTYKSLKDKMPGRYIQRADVFEEVEQETDTDISFLPEGLSCSSGVVESEVCVITDSKDVPEDYAGKILIAEYFEPGSVNLFAQAAGVISEKGNLLSHTAILCREMGIPAVVGVKNLLKRVKPGERVKLDGTRGKISIIK